MKTLIIAAAFGSICATALGQAGAEGGGSGAPAAPTSKLFDVELGLNIDHAFRSDVDGGGDVAVTRSMFSASFGHSFSPQLRGSLLVSTEVSWYDFDDAAGVIPGSTKPFSQLSETDLSPGVSWKLDDRWSALGGLYLRVAGENDADFSDSFTWGGYLAARYKPSDDFSVTFGVRATERLEDDWSILPALALDWRVSPTVRVQVVPAVGGAGVRITSEINDQWSFLIDGEYQTRAFRLNDEGPLAEGVVRDSRLQLGLGAVWTPCDRVQLTARAGVVAWQEFEIDDSDGDEISEVETDPTPYIFVGGTITF